MKTQQRVTMQPAFGTRFSVPKSTGEKLLANVEKFAVERQWDRPPTKTESLKTLRSLCAAIMEHNANPVNHVLDKSKQRIENIHVDKLCTTTIYHLETASGDKFLLHSGKTNAHETLKKIQTEIINSKNMTQEEKTKKFMAHVQPSKLDTVVNFIRKIFTSAPKNNTPV